MPFTSTSEEPLVRLELVNLVFQAPTYPLRSWRDAFTRLVRNPLEAVLSAPDRLHVARNINLEVHRGERVGIVGVNGAGKTTLCRCIAGMYRPSSGRITTRGRVRAVFDAGLGIHPELTGRENAHLLARFLFPEERDPKELVEEALDFSELGTFCDMPYGVYSNGMKARLCLSLISSRPSDILLLDEVFDGADQFFREKVAGRVVAMIRRSGAAILVSHSPEPLRRICTRLLVLHQGKIEFDGGVEKGLRFYKGLRPDV